MPRIPLNKKRQVTIPAAWTVKLGLDPGTPVWITIEGDAVCIRKAPANWTTYFGGQRPIPDETIDRQDSEVSS